MQSLCEKNITGSTQFGRSVSSAGDVNNDGFDDLIVGAPLHDFKGSCYIYFGGFVMDSIPDLIMTGDTLNGFFGNTVSGIGDVNNDGFDDVIVGEINFSGIASAYIYYGGTSMDNIADVIINSEGTDHRFTSSLSGAGDINNDGFDDVIIGAWAKGRCYIYHGGDNMDNIADVMLNGESSGSSFGYSVSCAGDVNADGCDDIIVGSSQYDWDTGRSYIYFGGSKLDTIPDIIMEGEGTYNGFGCSVSGVGDVNSDGFDDVLVGAYHVNSYTGKSYIFYGGMNMDSISDIVIKGEATNSSFGWSVSGAGDINSDGFDDVIIGAYHFNDRTGRSYIYFGSSDMDSIPDITLNAEMNSSEFGYSVSGAGDLNNDGYDDVIIGADLYKSYTGRAYIYLGSDSPNESVQIILTGEFSGIGFGKSVSNAGDVNNDGFDDLIVGAPGYNIQDGRAYIYFGGTTFDSIPDLILSGGADESFGFSVSFAGDVNNDGFDDVIVGAHDYNRIGRSYIYYGGVIMDNSPDVIMMGTENYEGFGNSVSYAGDVNSDGFDDVIVGAPNYNSGTGRALIYLGGTLMDSIADLIFDVESEDDYFGQSVSAVGDINNDSYDDVIVGASGYNSGTGRSLVYLGGSTMDDVPDLILIGEDITNYFGVSVNGAGDVNNDGFDDIIVGAIGHNSFTGRSYVYYGSSILNDTPDFIISGENNNDQFGWSVSEVGDFNDDGFDDIIVGARYYDSKKGRSYIIYGGTNMSDSADIVLTGEALNNYFGCSVSSVGDINNDGAKEVIIGADFFQSNGKVYVYSYSRSLIVETDSIVFSTENSVTAHGYLSSVDSENPAAHGFCWNTTGLPRITDNLTDLGGVSEIGIFTSVISELEIGITYYFRAYATNPDGTFYGTEISFLIDPASTSLQNKFNQVLTLFPNPTVNYIQFTWEGSDEKNEFKILDLSGQVVLSSDSYERGSKINLSSLTQGLYLIEVKVCGENSAEFFYKE